MKIEFAWRVLSTILGDIGYFAVERVDVLPFMLNKNARNISFQDIVCLSYVVNDNRTKSGSNPSMTKKK